MFKKLFILFLVCLLACKKTKVLPEGSFKVSVNFATQTIAINEVDSVVAVIKERRTDKTSFKKLSLNGNSYVLRIDAPKNTIDIQSLTIYSAYDTRSRRKYVLKQNQLKDVNVSAPMININDKWVPFVLLFNNAERIELAVAERQDVPLVEIDFPKEKWNAIYLDRITLNAANQVIDSEIMQISGKFEGKIINDQVFAAYCQRIKNKEWRESNIFFILMNMDTGEERIFSYSYVKRY